MRNDNRNKSADQKRPRDTMPTAAKALNEIQRVSQPLSQIYGNKPAIFLIGGELYQTAEHLKKLKTHQLRKVLDVAKKAVAIARSGKAFSEAQKRLFILLPMMAYNTGRASKTEKEDYQNLLEFVYKNVNEKSIQTPEDIILFDQMITTVVAYHKLCGGKD